MWRQREFEDDPSVTDKKFLGNLTKSYRIQAPLQNYGTGGYTCVFSVLDCRAGGRYRNDMLTALPDMPVTERTEDEGAFIRSNKPKNYLMDQA